MSCTCSECNAVDGLPTIPIPGICQTDLSEKQLQITARRGPRSPCQLDHLVHSPPLVDFECTNERPTQCPACPLKITPREVIHKQYMPLRHRRLGGQSFVGRFIKVLLKLPTSKGRVSLSSEQTSPQLSSLRQPKPVRKCH